MEFPTRRCPGFQWTVLSVMAQLCSMMTLMNMPIANGLKTCDQPTIMSFYKDACKVYKRSHQFQFLSKSDLDMEAQEMYEFLENGLKIVHGFMEQPQMAKSSQIRKKKQAIFTYEDNEIPSELFEGLDYLPREVEIAPVQQYYPILPFQGRRLWKNLMRVAVNQGGKVRRDVYSTVYKCCSHVGCSHSDFVHFC